MSAPLGSLEGPHTPTRRDSPDGPSPTRSPRKRSIDQVEGVQPTALSSPRSAVEASPYPCLCQPEPKIPRPRNAFILYRQHHNASVIARYPNMSNPEISKIIGELWRSEPEEEKNRWKSFAESGRQHVARRAIHVSTEKEQHHHPPTPKAFLQHHAQHSLPTNAEPLPLLTFLNTIRFHKGSLPRCHPLPETAPHRRQPDASSTPTALPARPHHHYAFPTELVPSKSLPPRSPSAHPPRRVSLPPASDLLTSSAQGQGMPPPPPHLPAQHRHFQQQQPGRLITRRTPPRADLSLNLPPIHTSLSSGSGPATGTGGGSAMMPPSAAMRSFAAAHAAQLSASSSSGGGMSAGGSLRGGNELALVRHKIGTLRQLLLPLPLLTKGREEGVGGDGKGRDGREGVTEKVRGKREKGRGAIVAVEGDSPSAARELADWLADAMRGQGDVSVFDGPRVPERETRVEELLKVVGAWHERGREVGRVVTGEDEEIKEVGKEGAGKEKEMTKSRKDSKSSAETDVMDIDEVEEEKEEKRRLLVLRGYVLTATNLFAARIPLTGNYDPKGHWEWTACLWRGIVAPDVIIYIKDVDGKEGVDLGGCEVLDDGRLIVVRRYRGETDKTGVEGVQAGALRRLGFEVGEWLRSFSG
ncbi:hypothetical protein KVT40_005020 [Elsinoe batatas]|uniref:HMG box domain-containing protein n=1 Tax=Elsinoe batatas TaxID=2601811 RepID=A0A8K0L1W5_9PEZI|nr:hypothetical protein KVT40_005020 [Elsinoe batatas]